MPNVYENLNEENFCKFGKRSFAKENSQRQEILVAKQEIALCERPPTCINQNRGQGKSSKMHYETI
jgi:hypothetical protein